MDDEMWGTRHAVTDKQIDHAVEDDRTQRHAAAGDKPRRDDVCCGVQTPQLTHPSGRSDPDIVAGWVHRDTAWSEVGVPASLGHVCRFASVTDSGSCAAEVDDQAAATCGPKHHPPEKCASNIQVYR